MSLCFYHSARTAITKCHGLEDLHYRYLFTDLEAGKCKTEMPAHWIPGGGLVPVSSLVSLPLFIRTLIPPYGCTLTASSKPNCLPKGPIYKYGHTEGQDFNISTWERRHQNAIHNNAGLQKEK